MAGNDEVSNGTANGKTALCIDRDTPPLPNDVIFFSTMVVSQSLYIFPRQIYNAKIVKDEEANDQGP